MGRAPRPTHAHARTHARCRALPHHTLPPRPRHSEPPQEQCSFNGAWRGTDLSKGRDYFISSYFWDRAFETGIIKDKNATTWETSAQVGVGACGVVVGD